MERREFLKTVGAVAGSSLLTGSALATVTKAGQRGIKRLPQAEPFARYGHATARLPGNRVLVIGGLSANGTLVSCQVYDPDTDLWYEAAPLALPRGYHSATPLASGEVLVLGGYERGPLSVASLYDPRQDRWQPMAPLLTPRYRHAAESLPDGRVVVTGGIYRGPLSEAEVYVP